MSKPTVRYRGAPIFVGGCAFVQSVDHYSPLCTPGHTQRTSPVVRPIDKTGAFETENTVYKPVEAAHA